MWRGKDCDDLDASIYPGRKASNDGDRYVDHNCNGIYGYDNSTGVSYEELYCSNTGEMGVILMGDSAGAHFHIPPQWMNVTEMSETVFDELYFVLLNEMDWPEFSSGTGFFNNISDSYDSPNLLNIINGPVDSLYKRFFQLNRCNHRDYQNLGVNGARSSSMSTHLDLSIRRAAGKDKPAYIVYELIGNDVCNPHPGMGHMTTPQEFYQNNLKVFKYLDSIVPNGTVLVANGLANGSVLYDNMVCKLYINICICEIC